MSKEVKAPLVRFNLRSPGVDKDKQVSILAVFRYTYQTKKVKLVYSTGHHIRAKHWDANRMRASKRIVSAKVAGTNSKLDKIEDTILDIWHEYGPIDSNEFKNHLNQRLGRIEAPDDGRVDFVKFMDQYVKDKSIDPSYNQNTLKSYNNARNIALEYIETTGERIEFTTFDWEFRNRWKQWCYAHKKYSINNTAKLWKRLNFFLKEANKTIKHGNYIYLEPGWYMKTSETNSKIRFTFKELKKIQQHDFSSKPRLEPICDLFVMMCHIGLRISDWHKASLSSIVGEEGNQVLQITMKKTNKEAVIPLFDEAADLLKKYDYQIPKYSDQKFNDYIKEVIEDVLPDKTFERKYSRAGKQMSEIVKAHLFTSSHSCRKSFATNYYEAGVSIANLMVCTGHQSEAAFRAYAEVDKIEAARTAKREFEMNRSKMQVIKSNVG